MSLSNRNVFNNENHFETYFSLIDISGFNRFLSFFYWMVSSDTDEELLFNIPFTGNIKLKGLIIMGGSHGHHSSKVKLFKNRPHLTFNDAQSKSVRFVVFVYQNLIRDNSKIGWIVGSKNGYYRRQPWTTSAMDTTPQR